MIELINNQFAAGFTSAITMMIFFKLSKLKVKQILAKSNPYVR